eukprot:CAMPEP_0172088300 /NCGR_PEP_ID=MMETSP1043-20130122/23161_1 /TAXON_ID=464988 /ORGANISM="Hemiselmis andersenii, Strain CCMP441" /LENGTH=50 /DNA_ID=CAMNT_0012750597 /DNA_START=171 /DNA_END=323 /DNA_ORIENTATION=-
MGRGRGSRAGGADAGGRTGETLCLGIRGGAGGLSTTVPAGSPVAGGGAPP